MSVQAILMEMRSCVVLFLISLLKLMCYLCLVFVLISVEFHLVQLCDTVSVVWENMCVNLAAVDCANDYTVYLSLFVVVIYNWF